MTSEDATTVNDERQTEIASADCAVEDEDHKTGEGEPVGVGPAVGPGPDVGVCGLPPVLLGGVFVLGTIE